jgi:hypothetical protein
MESTGRKSPVPGPPPPGPGGRRWATHAPGYSYRSASTTSSGAARRGGSIAASTPATPPTMGVRDPVQAVVLAYESGVVAPGATLSE